MKTTTTSTYSTIDMQKYLKNDLGRNEIAGIDLTFSAPKSVSLMLAKDEQTKKFDDGLSSESSGADVEAD